MSKDGSEPGSTDAIACGPQQQLLKASPKGQLLGAFQCFQASRIPGRGKCNSCLAFLARNGHIDGASNSG